MTLPLERAVRVSPYWPVLSNPVLRRVLPGFTISSLGDGMAVVAVGWLAIEVAGPADRGLWVALAVAAYSLSGAAGALLLGRFLRHRRPAQLAGWDAALRTAALGAVPISYAFGGLSIQLYVVLLATSSILHAWGNAGVYTLLARVLPQSQHLAGNAVLSSVGSLSTVLGPPLAGLLIVAGGAATVIAVDAGTFLVLAVTYLVLVPHDGELKPMDRKTPTDDKTPTDGEPSPTAGFRVIRRTPALFGLLSLSFVFFFLFGPVYVALPLHAADDLDGSAGMLAAFYSAFGLGAVLGSVLTGFLKRLRMWPTLIGIVIGFGLFMLPIGLSAPTAVAISGFAVAGLLWPPYASISTTLVQRSAADAQLPQVLAAKSAIGVLSVPLGTALGGPLVAAFGPTRTLLFCAAAITTLGLITAATATALSLCPPRPLRPPRPPRPLRPLRPPRS